MRNKYIILLLTMLKKTTVGGQALLEGLMMVGPEKIAVACRLNDGTISIDYFQPLTKTVFNKIPIVRGAVGLFKQMVLGSKALMLSAEKQDDEKPEEENGGSAQKSQSASNIILYLSTIFGILAGIALFILLPNFLTGVFLKYVFKTALVIGERSIIYNLIEGCLRLALLLGYLYLISFVESTNRLFKYHGADHKTIACYEAGEELTVANVSKFSRFHPRCGTSFLFLLVFTSVILFSLIGWYGIVGNMLIRLILVPLLAGIAYELLRWSGTHDNNVIGKIIALPGLWVQRLTTKEPDAPIIEVAIAAMNEVIPEDGNADVW